MDYKSESRGNFSFDSAHIFQFGEEFYDDDEGSTYQETLHQGRTEHFPVEDSENSEEGEVDEDPLKSGNGFSRVLQIIPGFIQNFSFFEKKKPQPANENNKKQNAEVGHSGNGGEDKTFSVVGKWWGIAILGARIILVNYNLKF